MLAAALAVGTSWAADKEEAAKHVEIPRQKWSFSGLLGSFDQAQLQRGFKVYEEACKRCHGVKRLAFRNLIQPGGPGFSEDQIKALAADRYKVDAAPDEDGKVVKRPAILSDMFPPPFKNDNEARSVQASGALPPDLSLIVRARSVESDTPFYAVPLNMLRDIFAGYQEGGADYLYAYLTGYKPAPPKLEVPSGMNYNEVFPAPHLTGMPDPFVAGPGKVAKYDDGTPETIENYARDVTAFLAWAADPHLEARKRLGLLVVGYLLITAILLYFAKRRIWSRAH
jgi:cytochrome c1